MPAGTANSFLPCNLSWIGPQFANTHRGARVQTLKMVADFQRSAISDIFTHVRIGVAGLSGCTAAKVHGDSLVDLNIVICATKEAALTMTRGRMPETGSSCLRRRRRRLATLCHACDPWRPPSNATVCSRFVAGRVTCIAVAQGPSPNDSSNSRIEAPPVTSAETQHLVLRRVCAVSGFNSGCWLCEVNLPCNGMRDQTR